MHRIGGDASSSLVLRCATATFAGWALSILAGGVGMAQSVSAGPCLRDVFPESLCALTAGEIVVPSAITTADGCVNASDVARLVCDDAAIGDRTKPGGKQVFASVDGDPNRDGALTGVCEQDTICDALGTITIACVGSADGFVGVSACAASVQEETFLECGCETLRIGLPAPDLELSGSCVPASGAAAETVCTISYANRAACVPDPGVPEQLQCGTAGFLRLAIDYEPSVGAVSELAASGTGGGGEAADDGRTVTWTPSSSRMTAGVVGPLDAGRLFLTYRATPGATLKDARLRVRTFWAREADFGFPVEQPLGIVIPLGGCPDGDEDGYDACVDCDDTDPTVYPGAPELCDELDNDCDAQEDEDDLDNDGILGCFDCDEGLLPDPDGDGFNHLCDCDDANSTVYPGAPELCDELDNDCDAQEDEDDLDGDFILDCFDCDPTRATVYPGAPELCDGLDNDCNGVIDDAPDGDFDGVDACGDCDDTDPNSHGTPGEVQNLRFTGRETLAWDPPAVTGGYPRFDTLRSAAPANFVDDTVCVESDDADTTAMDFETPPPHVVHGFLVRAVNDCPAGEGPLGSSSAGDPISGRSCP